MKKRQTSKDIKLEKARKLYGRDDKLWCFEFRGGHGSVGCVLAPDLSTAFNRMLTDQERMGHVWLVSILRRARKHKKLKQLLTVQVYRLEKPATWIPIKAPR